MNFLEKAEAAARAVEVAGGMMKQELSAREQLLHEASSLTGGDRNRQYGDPLHDMRLKADMWRAYSDRAIGKYSREHEAAMQMVFTKLARIANGTFNKDNYLDAAAYLAIAFECETRTKMERAKAHEAAHTGYASDPA